MHRIFDDIRKEVNAAIYHTYRIHGRHNFYGSAAFFSCEIATVTINSFSFRKCFPCIQKNMQMPSFTLAHGFIKMSISCIFTMLQCYLLL